VDANSEMGNTLDQFDSADDDDTPDDAPKAVLVLGSISTTAGVGIDPDITEGGVRAGVDVAATACTETGE